MCHAFSIASPPKYPRSPLIKKKADGVWDPRRPALPVIVSFYYTVMVQVLDVAADCCYLLITAAQRDPARAPGIADGQGGPAVQIK